MAMKRVLVLVLDSVGTSLPKVRPDDLVVFTADHGNDPYHDGTDPTREQVPLLTLGLDRPLRDGVFGDVARLVESRFGIA